MFGRGWRHPAGYWPASWRRPEPCKRPGRGNRHRPGHAHSRALEDTQASVGVLTELTIIEKDIQSIREAFRLFANVIDQDWVDAGFILRGVSSEGLDAGRRPAGDDLCGRRGADGPGRAARIARIVGREPGRDLPGPAIDVERARGARGRDLRQDERSDIRLADGGQATYGEHATSEGAVMLGGPIVANRLAFRVAAEYQRSETDLNYPLYEQFSRFDEFAEDEYYQVRGKLLFTPTVLNGGRALLTYAFAHDSPLYDDIAGPGLGFEYSERRGDLNAGTPFFQANRETDNHTAVFDVTTPFSDMLAFTSTTTYAFTRLDRSSINAGTPGEVFVANGFEDQTYVTQEFRLNFNSDRLQWVAGLYGAYEQSEIDQVTTNFFSGGRLDTSSPSSQTRNVAVFGEVNYEFVPTWKATLGGRLDYETQDQTLLLFARFHESGAHRHLEGRHVRGTMAPRRCPSWAS